MLLLRLLTIAALIGVLWASTAPSVSACYCYDMGQAQDYQVLRNWRYFNRVFQGAVEDRVLPGVNSEGPPFVWRYKFRVSRVWKGEVGEATWVRGGRTNCDWYGRIGAEYIIFEKDKWGGVSICGPTSLVEDADPSVLDFLGVGEAPRGTPYATWAGMGLVGAYIVGFFAWAARRD